MYATLGNITFQALKGFETLEDTVTASYAQHKLILSKPRLQQMGDELQEFNITGKFHIAFCNPEVEYDALRQAVEQHTVLPLVYGNGFWENDFVIQELKRGVTQTDDSGNYVEINWSITLLEFFDPNRLQTQQQRAKLSAFAVDTSRPLPIGTPKLDNTLSSQLYKYQQQVRNQCFAINQKINAAQGQINQYLNAPNAIIAMGQQFVNIANSLYSNIYPMQQSVSNNLSLMNTSLIGSTDLFNINPALQPTVASTSNISANLAVSLAVFATLPPVVSTNVQGQYALDTFNNTKQINDDLQLSIADIFTNFGSYAVFLASRKYRL